MRICSIWTDTGMRLCRWTASAKKSYQNLEASVEKARHTNLARLIYSLGIPNIGIANARMICREYKNDLDKMLAAPTEELAAMDGVGPVIAGAFVDFFAQEKNKTALELLLKEVELEQETFFRRSPAAFRAVLCYYGQPEPL